MTHTVTLETAQAFYKAYAARDIARMAEFIADDVEWTISGPVGVLPFCGTRQGKKAVLDLIEKGVPSVFRVVSFVLDQLLVDGDRVASLNRLSAHAPDGRVISYRLAHFLRFRDGKIVENLTLIDSFDAVEQVLGHPLVPDSPPLADADAGDVVAI
jgi:ketosteroid isomerase-like protein